MSVYDSIIIDGTVKSTRSFQWKDGIAVYPWLFGDYFSCPYCNWVFATKDGLDVQSSGTLFGFICQFDNE